MATSPFTPAFSFSPGASGLPQPLTLLASDARAEPDTAERQQAFALQLVMQADTGGQIGAWGNDRWEQTNHYLGAVALAIKPYLNALRAARFKVLERKPARAGRVTKSAGTGHYSRDEHYRPVEPDHPLCQIVERPNGDRGRWSLAREMAYLTLQYLLTGDAPAWTPCNDRGKPVQFYALVSAQTQLQYLPGVNPTYPRGAYRVTPYAGNTFGLAGGLFAGALLPGEEVHRLIDEDPWVRGAGRSRLSVGAAHIDVFEQITRSRHSFFRQGPMLGAAIVLPGADQSVTDAIAAALAKKHGGAENHGNRILVLGGGGMSDKAAVQPLSMNAEEMGFLQSFDQALEFVLALFGVPKVVAGVGAATATYATWYAAKQQFRDGALVPYFLRCSDFLTTALADPWGEEPGQYKIEVEPPPLDDLEMEQRERQYAAQAGLITVNEYRAATNRHPVPGGDVPLDVYKARLQPKPQQQPQPQVPQQSAGREPRTPGSPPQPDNDDAEGSRPPIAKAVQGAKREEGDKWQGPSGRWFVLKDGRAVPTRDPNKGPEEADGSARAGQGPEEDAGDEEERKAHEKEAHQETAKHLAGRALGGEELSDEDKTALSESRQHFSDEDNADLDAQFHGAGKAHLARGGAGGAAGGGAGAGGSAGGSGGGSASPNNTGAASGGSSDSDDEEETSKGVSAIMEAIGTDPNGADPERQLEILKASSAPVNAKAEVVVKLALGDTARLQAVGQSQAPSPKKGKGHDIHHQPAGSEQLVEVKTRKTQGDANKVVYTEGSPDSKYGEGNGLLYKNNDPIFVGGVHVGRVAPPLPPPPPPPPPKPPRGKRKPAAPTPPGGAPSASGATSPPAGSPPAPAGKTLNSSGVTLVTGFPRYKKDQNYVAGKRKKDDGELHTDLTSWTKAMRDRLNDRDDDKPFPALRLSEDLTTEFDNFGKPLLGKMKEMKAAYDNAVGLLTSSEEYDPANHPGVTWQQKYRERLKGQLAKRITDSVGEKFKLAGNDEAERAAVVRWVEDTFKGNSELLTRLADMSEFREAFLKHVSGEHQGKSLAQKPVEEQAQAIVKMAPEAQAAAAAKMSRDGQVKLLLALMPHLTPEQAEAMLSRPGGSPPGAPGAPS